MSDSMRALALGFALMLLSAIIASADPEMQCAPGEALVDLSPRMPPGVMAVWVIPLGSIQGQRVNIYQLGHPEKKVALVGGAPSRIVLQGRPRALCVMGGIPGISIDHVEYGG
jgi:hypothetical protein